MHLSRLLRVPPYEANSVRGVCERTALVRIEPGLISAILLVVENSCFVLEIMLNTDAKYLDSMSLAQFFMNSTNQVNY